MILDCHVHTAALLPGHGCVSARTRRGLTFHWMRHQLGIPYGVSDATIERASYEATPAPDGALAYVVRARLLPGQGLPRIGLRGTAKIYAGRVSLGYYLLRKPLAFARRSLGI